MMTCPAYVALALLAAISAAPAMAEEFKCPEGTKDSGQSPETQPGTVIRWCAITRDGRLLYHGPVSRWHPNGQMESKEYYIYGDGEGDFQSWYEDGTPRTLGTLRNGAKMGLWTYRYDTGSVESEVVYGDDFNDKVEYYRNGKRKSEGRFWQGGKVGRWVYWDREGAEKARCDFGDGLFELPDDGCRTIAAELSPEGYSRPVPVAVKTGDATAAIKVGPFKYGLASKKGWVVDTEAGRDEGTPLVLYPEGAAWRDADANIYFRILFRDGSSFDAIVKAEGEWFSQNVSGYVETSSAKGRTIGGRETVSKTIRYKPVIPTDSPFAIIADNEYFEWIVFLDLADEFVLVAVLACESEEALGGNSPDFNDLIASLRADP